MLLGLWSQHTAADAQHSAAGLDLRETLAGILAYTRWPSDPDPVRLCLVGNGERVEQLLRDGLVRPGHSPAAVRRVLPDGDIAGQCDALFLSRIDADSGPPLLARLNGQAVLTICERSEACTAGGMVRLEIDEQTRHVRFEVNLDAVARSTVRIHPQVLRLGRRPQAKGAP